jgi:tRNA A37 methylthiotransferase MiaB
LDGTRRRFKRFGLERKLFQQFLKDNTGFEFAMVQTVMTYWYLGVEEVIEDLRSFSPDTKIILGGPYATICTEHAKSLGADLVIEGNNLEPLWRLLDIEPDIHQPPLWQAYPKLKTAAMKINTGCPCKCTYCSVPKYFPEFSTTPIDDCIAQLELLVRLGVTDVAFYDDALLAKPARALIPLLEYIIDNSIKINLHTPNALHAKLLTAELAELLVRAGLRAVYLGYESSSEDFQLKTGGKVFADDLKMAVENLLKAGAKPADITAYQILGHPHSDLQELEQSLQFANSLGIKVMLADFSPIPETEDGEYCRRFTDIDEPLNHNKTAFPEKVIGRDEVDRLKQLCKKMNSEIGI